MDVTELLKVYGAGGVSLALLVMFFWFVRRVVEAVDKIPAAIAATGDAHKGEVKAIVDSHRDEVRLIVESHSAEVAGLGARFDKFILEFGRQAVEKQR